jgi:chromate transport protein ChrA
VGVAACWLGLFGPGIMLLYGLLPFWGSFRQNNAYRRALPGLSAAAVGLVVMAVFEMYNRFTCAPPAMLLARSWLQVALLATACRLLCTRAAH